MSQKQLTFPLWSDKCWHTEIISSFEYIPALHNSLCVVFHVCFANKLSTVYTVFIKERKNILHHVNIGCVNWLFMILRQMPREQYKDALNQHLYICNVCYLYQTHINSFLGLQFHNKLYILNSELYDQDIHHLLPYCYDETWNSNET